MSFLADLLTDSLTAVAASGRGKLFNLVTGLLALALAGGLLLYYLSWEPATVAAYHAGSISYTRRSRLIRPSGRRGTGRTARRCSGLW